MARPAVIHGDSGGRIRARHGLFRVSDQGDHAFVAFARGFTPGEDAVVHQDQTLDTIEVFFGQQIGDGLGEDEAGHDVRDDEHPCAKDFRIFSAPCGLLVRATTAFAWVWSTNFAGSTACRIASMLGVDTFGSVIAARSWVTMSESESVSNRANRSSGSSVSAKIRQCQWSRGPTRSPLM